MPHYSLTYRNMEIIGETINGRMRIKDKKYQNTHLIHNPTKHLIHLSFQVIISLSN